MLASRTFYGLTLAIALIGGLLGPVAHAEPIAHELPFSAGEVLTFKVSWLGISVGTATMSIEPGPSDAGADRLRFISKARSNAFFDTFHKVDDRAESLFDPHTLLPSYFYIRQHEGKRRSRYEMRFDQRQHRVTYRKRDNPAIVVDTPTGVQDPLSVLYTVRTMPLEVGKSLIIPLFNKGKTWYTEVKILKREQLDLPVGRVQTIKLQPMLREAGIFNHSGEMFVWVTDDRQRVPVQLSSTIKVGSIKARLTQAQGIQLTEASRHMQHTEFAPLREAHQTTPTDPIRPPEHLLKTKEKVRRHVDRAVSLLR